MRLIAPRVMRGASVVIAPMNYEQDRFGSAACATRYDLEKSGLLNGSGISFGFDETKKKELRVCTDGSVAIFGGARCGKSASAFSNALIGGHLPGNFVCFSPRGELDAVSILSLSLQGYKLYFLNHTGMHGLPQHRTNPLDNQTIDSPSLVADIQKSALDFCATPSGVRASWPYDDARQWYADLSLYDAERNGCVSLSGIYELLTVMTGDIDRWCDHLEAMSISRFPSVVSFSGEILQLQKEGRESFTGPLSVLKNAFSFMRDERLQDMLSDSDFSLQWLTDINQKMGVFIDWPIEYIQTQAAAIRQILGAVIQHKMRAPGSAPVSVLVDEAGQLKAFPSIRELFTFGGGAGLISNMAAWQEEGQLKAAFGEEAQEIIGSAQYRIYAGIRTDETARLVSSMSGTMTLEYDTPLEQSNARRLKTQAANQMLKGGDFMKAAHEMRHYKYAETHRTKQARAVLQPDEVLNLPPSAMVAFASGLVSGPIMGHWIPHYKRKDFAGKYLNNPYHGDRVIVQTFWGERKCEILEERVPERIADLPQYQNGYWRYVKGYRPNI